MMMIAMNACALRSVLARSLILGTLAGCAVAQGIDTETADTVALGAAVRNLVGNASCDRDEQCRTVAFGAKPCGGPQSYLAWSTVGTDPVALQAAAEKFATSVRKDIERRGIVSNCSIVVDPGAHCVASGGDAASPTGAKRTCRLNSPRGSAAQ